MGRRGPVPGAVYGKKPGRKSAADHQLASVRALELVPVEEVPEPPDHLGDVGRQVWHDVWSGFPSHVLNEQLDSFTVQRIAMVADERQRYSEVLRTLGPVLTEPIVSPSGAVVGERVVPNPAEAMLDASGRSWTPSPTVSA